MVFVPLDESPPVTLDAVLVTDVGMVRDHNEDSAHIDDERAFFIVADGMGGHAAGEVASAMAVDTVRQTIGESRAAIAAFTKAPTDQGRKDLVQLLQNAVLAAHQAVFQRGNRESDKQGMGTTLDVMLIAGHEAFVAHVGDSRTYLIRDGRADQITTDHTVAEVLVIEGKLSIEEAQVSPLRTILVNAIGVSAEVGVEMAHLQLRRGDRILVCSDGLHDYFTAEQEIADKLSEPNPGAALAEMVELAKERGGHDNITGVVVNILEVASSSDGVPGMIEMDQTQPVDIGNPPSAATPWNDDEHTENLPARERAAPLTMPDGDAATRATAPMSAMSPPDFATTTDDPSARATAPMRPLSRDELAKLRAAEAKLAALRSKAPPSTDDPTVELPTPDKPRK
jgi:serine/threonine protein phosphatase PrpC